MPREIVGRASPKTAGARKALDLRDKSTNRHGMTTRVRRSKRSQEYIDAMRKMDVGVHGGVVDREALEETIVHEFPDFGDLLPIGIVARCYLGAPYEVHTLDCVSQFIDEHYERGRPLPGDLEKVRKLALHPSYALIEVYQDRTVAVLGDGSIVELDDA